MTKFSKIEIATVSVHGESGMIGHLELTNYDNIKVIKKLARRYSIFAKDICVMQIGGFCQWYKL